MDEVKTQDLQLTEEQLNAAAEKQQRRFLRPGEIAAFVLNAFGQKNLASYIDNWKQFFMMNFWGISGTAFGTINLVTSIWDALDDPLSGIIIDRTRTRWGRLRPFFVLPMPLWIMTTLSFFIVPWFIPASGRFVYALVMSILHSIGFSYYGAWNILLYNLTPNTSERDTLIATQKFAELIGVWIPSMVPVVLDFLPKLITVKQQTLYTGFAVFFVIFAALFSLIAFFRTKERVPMATSDQMKETSVFKSFLAIAKNRPFLVLLLSGFFSGVKGIGGASESFFWLNNTGRLTNGTIAGLFTGIPNYIITPTTPKLIRRFGARNVAVAAGIFGGVMYTVMFLIGYKPFGNSIANLVYLTIMLTICGLPNCVMGVCNPVLTGDVYDYLEWKIGVRNEGLVNAVNGYITKLSSSVIGLLQGLVFDLIRYQPLRDLAGNLIPQTDEKMLLGIFAVFALAPAVARFGYGVSMLLFNVHGKFRDQMLADLAQRRAQNTTHLESK